MKVVVLGAGGNLGPCIVTELEKLHTLRVTDVKPMETPHEYMQVNVASPEEVRRAVEGMDAVVNLTVLRDDPILSFEVNTWGAYNVCKACIEHGVKRLVHSGPVLGPAPYPIGYRADFGIVEEAPSRPGTGIYSVTKHLAEEICKSFADQHGLSVVGIRLCGIHKQKEWPYPVYWGNGVQEEDLGQAVCLAVAADNLPSNFEVFNIFCDSPVGTYPIDKAKRLLGFKPKYNYEASWNRTFPQNGQ